MISLIIFIMGKITLNIFNLLLEYATAEVTKISSIIINNAVTDDVLKDFENYELFTITKNNDDEIEMIDYNSTLVNLFLRGITSNIQNELLKIETGEFSIINKENSNEKVLFYIPLGAAFNNPVFNNFGPKIPVRVEFVGSVLTNISTTIKEYGINNSLIEMTVHIEVREKVLLPILSKEIIVTNEVPLSYKIITGNIPNYYGKGLNKNSSIYSIPIE